MKVYYTYIELIMGTIYNFYNQETLADLTKEDTRSYTSIAEHWRLKRTSHHYTEIQLPNYQPCYRLAFHHLLHSERYLD